MQVGVSQENQNKSEWNCLWISHRPTLFMLDHRSGEVALIFIPHSSGAPEGTEKAEVFCERKSGVCICM